MAGFSLLVLLIVLAVSLLMSERRSGEAVREVDRVQTPAPSPRSLGTSTLSHGGPAPAGTSKPSEPRRAVDPFFEPAFRTSQESPVSQGAEGVPSTGRIRQMEGASPGSGGQGP